jgi:hypothetical protein
MNKTLREFFVLLVIFFGLIGLGMSNGHPDIYRQAYMQGYEDAQVGELPEIGIGIDKTKRPKDGLKEKFKG